jgi:hypothetical protein
LGYVAGLRSVERLDLPRITAEGVVAMSGLLIDCRYDSFETNGSAALAFEALRGPTTPETTQVLEHGKAAAFIANPKGWLNQILAIRDHDSFLILKGDIFTVEGRRVNDRSALMSELFLRLAEYVSCPDDAKGAQFLTSLNGSFLIVFSANNGSDIFVVTDKFSSHHAFYAEDSTGRALIATAASAIAHVANKNFVLDKAAISSFICFQRLIGDQAFFLEYGF